MLSLAAADVVVRGIPTWVDVAAAAVGALSGGLVAVRYRFDINGTLLLAIVTGLGGGIIRDVVLSAGPPVAFRSPLLLPAALAVGLVVVVFARNVDRITARIARLVLVVDAVFLGVYSVVGVAKGINAGLPGVSCVLLGVLTGLGGGLLRDILVNEQPEVLRPGAAVAMTSVAGCSLYVVALAAIGESVGAVPLALVSGLLIVTLRLVAVWRRWESPATTELHPLGRLRLPQRALRTREVDGEPVAVAPVSRTGPLERIRRISRRGGERSDADRRGRRMRRTQDERRDRRGHPED